MKFCNKCPQPALCVDCGKRWVNECNRKIVHLTLAEAHAHAHRLMQIDGDLLLMDVYRCSWNSEHYHVGHMQRLKRKRFQQAARKRHNRELRRLWEETRNERIRNGDTEDRSDSFVATPRQN